MSADTLTLPTDVQVFESVTNIKLWLENHSRAGPQQTPEEITSEDLAVAVPGECLFPELNAENEDASHEEEKGILVYTDSQEDKYIWLKGDWHPLERVLGITSPKNGWVRTPCLGERLLVLVLTQLDYAAREEESEVPYGCCPLGDPAYLLWHQQRPAGMCSLKRKGTSIWGGEDLYACDTLDTMYVRPHVRRQGYTLSLLHTLASKLPPGDHLGLSHPVSLSMCKVLLKFIQVYPELRDAMWTLDEDGEVSGTATLMLGSLMVRGALQGVRTHHPHHHHPPHLSQPMNEAEQPMEQADQPMEQGQQQKQCRDAQSQDSEPCDTS
ncbi:Soluble lamin-associated protein [Chionoecetes opilio]|uniref:Soluble lamin-associated protein n=1 Tax=Chionoecetes opilio TaxID=41210 RepID=A0A8J4XW53_CHIOP|nr:Soluble lamin-associated protein [Chionoecetes opilio]